ncbi:MAG: ABC transporter substrate-binding protein [Coriobacteriales bacterium]|jgi:NitT/TauT family transport system substrate-binding protein|nr:ABC transporter substrate-binding protein [Coriobacteriales bacterium]
MRSGIGKRLVAAALAALLAAGLGLLGGCGAPAGTGGTGGGGSAAEGDASAAATEFPVAFCTWIGYAPLYIAEEKGYFSARGIAPELTIIEDESQYAAALYSGSIQALGNVLDREVIHFASGTPETVAFALDESSGGDGVIASGDIQSVADLKGRTVGLDKSSTSYFFFLSILEKNGLAEGDVTIEDMGADDAGTAFLAGNLDAAVVWEPYLSESNTREGGHVLASSAEYPKTIVDVMVVRSDFAAENPQAVEALTAAWYEAIEFYRANPDEGNEIMARGLGLDVDEIADMASGITFMGAEENATFLDRSSDSGIYEVAERAMKFWQGMGVIDAPFELNDFISDAYYRTPIR